VSDCARCTGGAPVGFIARRCFLGGEILVEVADRGGGEPVMRSPSPSEPTGRGLRIVDMLAAEWGVDHQRDSGKTIWFTVASPTGPDAEVPCQGCSAPS
jgi:hypothetical protein